MKKIGSLGEELVARWLETQGWTILQQRWHCPWGEIDVIAKGDEMEMLIFVEVKTRSLRNWDGGGIEAISRQKQEKIWLTAQTFLSQYPHLAHLPCRFDVALVSHRKNLKQVADSELHLINTTDKTLSCQGSQFTLDSYFESAFTLE